MEPLLSAKGNDVTTWRAVEDFALQYRQALLNINASNNDTDASTVLADNQAALESALATHRHLLERLNASIADIALAAPTTDLKELTKNFYEDLYSYFGYFQSATAFYQLSMAFLRQIASAVIARASLQSGVQPQDLPEIALIAIGPAGRFEYSPFCPLQILLVHSDISDSQQHIIELFCNAVHSGFESAGMAVDTTVTPANSRWRGTLSEWQQRCEESLYPKSDEELIDICRLIDQYPLYSPNNGFADALKRLSRTTLNNNRSALENLVERITALSNGLGLMGRLKLDRSGSERGYFRLLDHGLLPFSAALSALALLKQSPAVSNPERVLNLLKRRELSVELAERMLATWHELHGSRLRLEQFFHIDRQIKPALFVNPNELSVEQRQALKKTLESVATIQQHVAIVFSGMGD